MNKIALRNFATEARRELREKIIIKAMQLGITEENIKIASVQSSDAIFVDGRQLTLQEGYQRNKLIEEIKTKGYNQVIEEVAYTWFNRFTALRFMEVNDYLPTKVRVLSSKNEGSYEPDIIKEALNINLDIDKELVYRLKTSKDNDAIDKLYKYLVLAQCNGLSNILPFIFGQTNDYTKLLFPDGLLSEGSFLRKLTNLENIPESDWKNVEIIGWLYQYYIAEENERVIQAKKRYKKEEIPFATQLFTPEWIVRYMVQNALGRYWVESHSEDRELIKEWEYYLENPKPEADFEEKLAPYLNKQMKVEDIKCFDPAMGSGHILVYMFDILYQIYSRCGYLEKDIPKLIIENNLYGLEIDDRAYQLACFAVIMKAQQYNSRFLRNIESNVRNTGEYINFNLASIQETNDFNIKDIEYLAGETSGKNFEKTRVFIEQFRDAKIYGSLTKIQEFDEGFLTERVSKLLKGTAGDLEYQSSRQKVDDIILDLIKQTKIMNAIYDVLVTNPPYIGNKYLYPLLSEFITKEYSDVKSDIFSAFIVYSLNKTNPKGQLGFMTPFVWMFITSFEKLRKKIINHKSISSLIQLEYSGFDGATVPICTFTLRNINNHLSGEYIRLSDFKGSDNQPIKANKAAANPYVEYRYTSITDNYNKIPGSPIAYWTSEDIVDIFTNSRRLSYYADAKFGLSSANNDKYIRSWTEIDFNSFSYPNMKFSLNKNKKWFPANNGGYFRKWFGNNEDVIFWLNDGYELKNNGKSTIRNKQYFYREGITWTSISSSKISFRSFEEGYIFTSAGFCIFEKESESKEYLIGFLNSKVNANILSILAPTLNFNVGNIADLPIIEDHDKKVKIKQLVNKNINISKNDWDSFETSWDFKIHPLLNHLDIGETYKLSNIFSIWETETDEAFNQLKLNEEELNRIFIHIYGLQDELTPEVEDKDITISKADRERDIKSFLSYAVGCMFGRYSLDEKGLIYAGGEFDPNKYKIFPADKDNVLPILSDSYFEDDIVSKFAEFVSITFGQETLNENLKYIAESLGIRGNETSRETIRRYFLNDFYKNHTQIYKKRPIYWLFSSGKEKAFNALIYMHRYDSSSLARIRTDYLHVLQSRLDVERQTLLDKSDEQGITVKEKREYEKELKDLDKKIFELKEYDEVLHHMADKKIEIDLDDGVVVNYEKFEGLVQKI